MVDFPASPTDGQRHTEQNMTWQYMATPGAWRVLGGAASVGADPTTVGAICAFTVATVPDGWLICDGSSFNPATYPDLAALLGGTDLPDLTDQFLKSSGVDPVGTIGGEKTHTLTVDEIPPHNHAVYYQNNADGSGSQDTVSTEGGADGNRNSGNTGGGLPHNNEPQFYVVVWAMRAFVAGT